MFKERAMSLTDFHEQLREHRHEIKQTSDSAFLVYEQFAEKIIYPEHCDQMKDTIRKMRVSVRSLYRLLNTPSHLPLTMIPYSFSPAITLRQVDELNDELMILITLFHKTCYPPSQDIQVYQQEIRHKLYALVQGYEDILQQLDRLFLQVLAQEKAERQRLRSLMYSS
jgi:hypothetical protein